MTTTAPTTASHPYSVGRMIYATLDEACSKARITAEAHPGLTLKVVERSTGRAIAEVTLSARGSSRCRFVA